MANLVLDLSTFRGRVGSAVRTLSGLTTGDQFVSDAERPVLLGKLAAVENWLAEAKLSLGAAPGVAEAPPARVSALSAADQARLDRLRGDGPDYSLCATEAEAREAERMAEREARRAERQAMAEARRAERQALEAERQAELAAEMSSIEAELEGMLSSLQAQLEALTSQLQAQMDALR